MQIYYLRSLSWTFWNVGFETIGVSNGFQGNTNGFSFVEELKLKFLGQFWFVLKNSRIERKFWGKRECWRFGQHLNPSTYCKCWCCRAATSMWQKICRDEWGSAGGERLLRFTVFGWDQFLSRLALSMLCIWSRSCSSNRLYQKTGIVAGKSWGSSWGRWSEATQRLQSLCR